MNYQKSIMATIDQLDELESFYFKSFGDFSMTRESVRKAVQEGIELAQMLNDGKILGTGKPLAESTKEGLFYVWFRSLEPLFAGKRFLAR